MSMLPKVEYVRGSRTVQAGADRTDIRAILKRARRTGDMTAFMTSKQAYYMDISDAPDFIAAQNIVAKAKAQFEMLPSDVRDRFNNDPAKFLAFATDPANVEDLYKMGIKARPAEPEVIAPMKVEVVNPEPPKSS